jgi:hypothetical protein
VGWPPPRRCWFSTVNAETATLKTETAAAAAAAAAARPATDAVRVLVSYSWADDQRDLDTHTTFAGEVAGWSCGNGGIYLKWVSGGRGGG